MNLISLVIILFFTYKKVNDQKSSKALLIAGLILTSFQLFADTNKCGGLNHHPIPTIQQLEITSPSEISGVYASPGIMAKIVNYKGKSLKNMISVEVEKCFGRRKDKFQLIRLGSFQIEGDPSSKKNEQYIKLIQKQLTGKRKRFCRYNKNFFL